MKILVVTNDAMFEDNDEIYIESSTGGFLVTLSRNTDKLTLFHFKMRFAQSRRLADFKISGKGINILNVSWTKYKFLNYVRAAYRGYFYLKKADFFYVFYPGHLSKIMCFFAFVQGKKFGMYIRGEKDVASGLARFFYKRAQIVLTVSSQFTDQIISFGGNAQTIRPMIDYNEQDVVIGRQYAQKSQYRLLYVGRLETRKGTFDLIYAVKRVRELGLVNFVLDVVGDGPEVLKIKELADQLDLSEMILFHGSVSKKEELKKYYLNSDLFVFPSHDEGFPRVIYEASILGLPIATTFVGTIGNLMKNNVNCYQLPVKKPHEMGDVIYNILKDYNAVAAIAQSAKETVLSYLGANKYPHEEQLLRTINML